MSQPVRSCTSPAPSFLDFYGHPGITAIPIRDLPPREIALVWLKEDTRLNVQAFARAAADVLKSAPRRGRRP